MPARKKSNPTEPKKTDKTEPKTESTEPKSTKILATGLEDYGRWKSMFQNHKRNPKEKPFRRGRIWC